jgi:hypothetical protein
MKRMKRRFALGSTDDEHLQNAQQAVEAARLMYEDSDRQMRSGNCVPAIKAGAGATAALTSAFTHFASARNREGLTFVRGALEAVESHFNRVVDTCSCPPALMQQLLPGGGEGGEVNGIGRARRRARRR